MNDNFTELATRCRALRAERDEICKHGDSNKTILAHSKYFKAKKALIKKFKTLLNDRNGQVPDNLKGK